MWICSQDWKLSREITGRRNEEQTTQPVNGPQRLGGKGAEAYAKELTMCQGLSKVLRAWGRVLTRADAKPQAVQGRALH